MENLKLAHKNASKNKSWYEEVQMVNNNQNYYLKKLQKMLVNHTYKTSKYETFTKKDGKKERLIYKLPYFPDRICQWAIVQVIEPILLKQFTADTYSAIPNRGIHQCLHKVQKAVYYDEVNSKYCLKLDVKKFYPSINHTILKNKYRKIFKDKNLLWILEEIINSTPEEEGIPIGNYLSQYSGNFYLSSFDHWIKEVKHIKYYFRYMDDIVIFHNSKEFLHQLRKEIEQEFNLLNLNLKDNWQVFPVAKRGIDFVGYRIFYRYTLLRKSTCKNLKIKLKKIQKRQIEQKPLTYSLWCSVNSYKGWIKHCNCYNLQNKYIKPIEEYCQNYYINNIAGGAAA